MGVSLPFFFVVITFCLVLLPYHSLAATIINVSSYNVVPNDNSLADDNSANLQTLADYASTLNDVVIVFDTPGAVYYTALQIFFTNARNLVIDGQGATIVNVYMIGFISFNFSVNVAVRNISFDNDPKPYFMGLVMGSTLPDSLWRVNLWVYPPTDVNTVKRRSIDALTNVDVATGRILATDVDTYQIRWVNTNWVNSWPNEIGDATLSYGAQYDDRMVGILPKPGAGIPPAVGTVLMVRLRSYQTNGIQFYNTVGSSVSDVTFYSIPGMGLYGENSTDLSFRSVQVLRNKGFLMTATADIIHLAGCRGHVEAIDCYFEGMGDDGCNIHSHNLKVRTFDRATRMVRMAATSAGNYPFLPYAMVPGELLEFGSAANPFQVYFVGTVVSATEVVDEYYDVILVEPLPAQLAVNDIVVPATTPSLFVKNMTVANNRGRGFLLKNRNTLVQDCQFVNNSGAGIQIATDIGFWSEGSTTRNITMKDTLITSNNFGANQEKSTIASLVEYVARPPGAHQDLTFVGNLISKLSRGGGMSFGSSLNVNATNNFISVVADTPFIYCNSDGIRVSDNHLVYTTSSFSRVASGCTAASNIVEGAQGSCAGLYGQYYSNDNLDGAPVVAVRNSAPSVSGVTASGPYSVLWTGTLMVGGSAVSSLTVRSSDGIVIWIDDRRAHASWLDAPASSTIIYFNPALPPNSVHSMKVKYYSSVSTGTLSFTWSSTVNYATAFCSASLTNSVTIGSATSPPPASTPSRTPSPAAASPSRTSSPSPSPSPSSTPPPTLSATPSVTPSVPASRSPGVTPSASPTSSPSRSISPSISSSGTDTPSPSSSPETTTTTPTPTTPSPATTTTSTPTSTSTTTPSPSHSASPSASSLSSASSSPSPSRSPDPSPATPTSSTPTTPTTPPTTTPSPSRSASPSASASASTSASGSPGSSPAASPTTSATPSPSRSASPSASSSASPSASGSPGSSPAASPTTSTTPSPSPSRSASPTATASATPSPSASRSIGSSPAASTTPSATTTSTPSPSASRSIGSSPAASTTPATTTSTPSPSASRSIGSSPAASTTPSASTTSTPSRSASPSASRSVGSSPAASTTPTTPSRSPSGTASRSASTTPTTPSPSRSRSASASASGSASRSASRSPAPLQGADEGSSSDSTAVGLGVGLGIGGFVLLLVVAVVGGVGAYLVWKRAQLKEHIWPLEVKNEIYDL